MLQKFSEDQTNTGKCFRKFLQGKQEPENASENFRRINRCGKMLQKISEGQIEAGKWF